MKNKKILIASIGTLVMVVVLCCVSLLFVKNFLLDDDEKTSEEDNNITYDVQEIISKEESCDDTLGPDNYLGFHGIEETKVSIKPCEVMWLLAKSYEEYELKTANGKTIYVVVWQDYANNTQAASTFTIRATDVKDDGIGDLEGANVVVVRWVANKEGLVEAKNEIEAEVAEIKL